MNKNKKIILTVVLLVLIQCAFLCSCGLKPKFRENVNLWQTGEYEDMLYGDDLAKFLPEYSEDNNYSNAAFYYHDGECLSWSYAREAYCLELTYNEITYDEAKSDVLSKYNYLSEIKKHFDDDYYILPCTECEIGSYNVKVIDEESFTFGAGQIAVTAFNDEAKIIRYVYVVNISLDFFYDEQGFKDWITINFNIEW